MKVYYRLGTAGEKRLFEDFSEHFYGIAIGANLAAFYPDWLPTFLRKVRKPFFIDPATYVFARSLENIRKETEIKKSFQKLANKYGNTLNAIIISPASPRQLIPKDFLANDKWNQDFLDELAKEVIAFQQNVMQAPSQMSLLEYARILGEEAAEEVAGPEFLVAPYFFFTSIDDPWYQISLELAKKADTFKGSQVLHAVICMSRELLLDAATHQRLLNDYKEFDGLMLWISDFDEKQEGEEHLVSLIDFVRAFSRLGKPIFALYGEYFSAILSKFGMSGYSRGICYGAGKSVDAAAGGARLPQRYYMALNHGKLSEAVARTFSTDYPDQLCTCKVCSDLAAKITEPDAIARVSRFFDEMNFFEARGHFMTVHSQEQQTIDSESLPDIAKRLAGELNTCRRLRVRLYNIVDDHLVKWESAISKRLANSGH